VIVLALIVAGLTLITGVGLAFAVRRLRTLRRQLAGLALVTLTLPLAAVALSGALMFQSSHDLTVLLWTASAASVALFAAILVGKATMDAIEQLETAASRFAQGDLTARAPEHGPAELAELARSFNEMAVSIEGLFEGRREFVAWASHDLRTPLAALQAMLEAVEDGLAPPEHYLPEMQDQVRRLSSLVEDLFELARIDAGALTLELEEAELAGVVESCVRALQAEAEARRISLEARIGTGVPPVRCAPEKIERVLYNLLTNALRHTPSDGSVAVRVDPGREDVQVTVEDSGEGIAEAYLHRVFDRFWRGDFARSGTEGAGLGLAIARGLVEAHGGRIWVENKPTGGTRVAFTLPAGAATS